MKNLDERGKKHTPTTDKNARRGFSMANTDYREQRHTHAGDKMQRQVEYGEHG